jgi:small-conductance mechanosensitive channel/CRP-like cAMP-binding protein
MTVSILTLIIVALLFLASALDWWLRYHWSDWRRLRRAFWIAFLVSGALYVYGRTVAWPPLDRWLRLAWLAALSWLILRLLDTIVFEVFLRGARIPSLLREILIGLLFALGLVLSVQWLFRVQVAPILATSAVLSIIVGLALQETLSNLFAGISLNLEGAFTLGDWVKVQDHVGQVREINWRSVHLVTRTGETVVCPNAAIAREVIVNYSRPAGRPRIHKTAIGLPYDVPPDHISRALREALEDLPVRRDPPPEVRIAEFAAYSIVYEVRFAYDDFSDLDRIDAELRYKLWYTLRRHGIEIPYPIQIEYHRQESPEPLVTLPRLTGFLESHPLFQGLPYEVLEQMAREVRCLPYARHQVIFRQGDPPDGVYIIMEGQVGIWVRRHKHERRIALLGPGDIFGEFALIRPDVRTGTARAVQDAWVIRLPLETVRRWMERYPAIRDNIVQLFESRMEALETFLNEETQEMKGQPPEKIRQALVRRLRSLLGFPPGRET